MEKIMILVSGMAATGKTTIATKISKELRLPLVCYDNIATKTKEIMNKDCENTDLKHLLSNIPYELFWFNLEEILKTSSSVIADYIFSEQCNDILSRFAEKYGYKIISVHCDAKYETAYERYIERSINTKDNTDIRPSNIDFERFSKVSKQNKEFHIGERRIYVDTNDFSKISFDELFESIYEYKNTI